MPGFRGTTLNSCEYMANVPKAEYIIVIDAIGTQEDSRLIELLVHFRQELTVSLEAANSERNIQEHIRSIVEIIDRIGQTISTARRRLARCLR